MEECYRCEFENSCDKSGCADRGYITICKEKYNKLIEKMRNLEEELIHNGENIFFREQELLKKESKLKELEKTRHFTCKNETEINPVDEFICSNCGFITEDFSKLKIDEDNGERWLSEFEIKYCPNCGAKVIE